MHVLKYAYSGCLEIQILHHPLIWRFTYEKDMSEPDTKSLFMFIFQTDGNMIVSTNANFGLVRKRSSGRSTVESLHSNCLFEREEDVEEYLLSHPDSSKPNEVNIAEDFVLVTAFHCVTTVRCHHSSLN